MNINAVILQVKTKVKQRQGRGGNSKYMLYMRHAYNSKNTEKLKYKNRQDIMDKL